MEGKSFVKARCSHTAVISVRTHKEINTIQNAMFLLIWWPPCVTPEVSIFLKIYFILFFIFFHTITKAVKGDFSPNVPGVLDRFQTRMIVLVAVVSASLLLPELQV